MRTPAAAKAHVRVSALPVPIIYDDSVVADVYVADMIMVFYVTFLLIHDFRQKDAYEEENDKNDEDKNSHGADDYD